MRLFLALHIPGEVKRQIVEVQERLRGALSDGWYRWVNPDLFHVTLAFLGEVPDENLSIVKDRSRELCAGCPKEAMTFGSIGYFPSVRHPKVLWIGAKEGGSLIKLARQLSSSCGPLGDSEVEKHVALHVTLARAKRPTNSAVAREVASFADSEQDSVYGKAVHREVLLFQSTLGQRLTRHEVIDRFPLGSSPSADDGL